MNGARGVIGRTAGPVSGWTAGLSRCACADDADDHAKTLAVQAATSLVWQATCGRFPGVFPAAGRWFGPACWEIDLEAGFAHPVVSVVAVRQINDAGQVVARPAGSWRFDPPGLLVAQELGDGSWPAFPEQLRRRAVNAPGSWWVEVTIGQDPPAEVLAAVELLACELLKAWSDPSSSALPDNVTSIARQGTTITFDRSQWAGVPLVAQIAAPYPQGWGCTGGDATVLRDPAAHVTQRAVWPSRRAAFGGLGGTMSGPATLGRPVDGGVWVDVTGRTP